MLVFTCFFYLRPDRFGDYLCVLLSEIVNILINLFKITYRRSKSLKKEKFKREQKRV